MFLTEDAVEFYIFSGFSSIGQNILILLDDILYTTADGYNLTIQTKEYSYPFMLLFRADKLKTYIDEQVAKK